MLWDEMRMTIQQLTETHEGKNLRVEFNDGEIAEVRIISVSLPNKYDTTPESWGIVYAVTSSNRPGKAPKGSANWSQLNEIKCFEFLGEK